MSDAPSPPKYAALRRLARERGREIAKVSRPPRKMEMTATQLTELKMGLS
jgi:hypothetical protein